MGNLSSFPVVMTSEPSAISAKTRILFLGDTFFRTLSDRRPFENIESFLKDFIVIVNCETVITSRRITERRKGKLIHVSTDEEKLGKETLGSITAVTVANNHMLDFGMEGLQNSLDFFESHNKTPIGVVGRECSIFAVNGQRVAIFACVEKQDKLHRTFPTLRDAMNSVHELRAECDCVVVAIHWGTEYADYPSPRQRRQARLLIEAGADLIVGHHSHVFQGSESYRGKRVYYSLGNGNFGSWQNKYSEWSRVALCVELIIHPNDFSVREHYLKIDDDYGLTSPSADQLEATKRRFIGISNEHMHLTWISWGMMVSEVFVKQELDAFRERFKDRVFFQGVVFLYWLTRPKTVFLLLCFVLRKIGLLRMSD